jgi:hypothetical protein
MGPTPVGLRYEGRPHGSVMAGLLYQSKSAVRAGSETHANPHTIRQPSDEAIRTAIFDSRKGRVGGDRLHRRVHVLADRNYDVFPATHGPHDPCGRHARSRSAEAYQGTDRLMGVDQTLSVGACLVGLYCRNECRLTLWSESPDIADASSARGLREPPRHRSPQRVVESPRSFDA